MSTTSHRPCRFSENIFQCNFNILPCLHGLVDYITSVLLRTFQRSMKGDFWLHNCIRVLATVAAKVKTLGYNLTEASTAQLRRLKTKDWAMSLPPSRTRMAASWRSKRPATHPEGPVSPRVGRHRDWTQRRREYSRRRPSNITLFCWALSSFQRNCA